MQNRNVFAGPYLDRAGHLRQDAAAYETALSDPHSKALPVWNLRSLVSSGSVPRSIQVELAQLTPAQRGSGLIWLGRFANDNVFAWECEGETEPALISGASFQDLRMIAATLLPEEAGLLSYARAMISWRQHHRFCGTCGARTVPAKGGHLLLCTNPKCRHEVFPRIDPAIIVLISDGDRVLLGRQASWPAQRYSTIAGFVEPGESLEDAVSREVFEETGVRVEAIEYHSSQPWPFPSSLMLGFTARAATFKVDLRDQELEDARWFTRGDIAAGIARIPPSVSISFRLLEYWFDQGGSGRLRDLVTDDRWPAVAS